MGAIDTTYTFSANDVITSTKMNNIIDQTTFTSDAVFDTTLAVSSGKLKVNAQGITSNEMAINSVRTDSITDLSVTSAKLADSSVTTSKIDSSVGLARAILKGKTGVYQNLSASYLSILVGMSITTGSSPRTVSVACTTPHGYSVGDPFFIHTYNAVANTSAYVSAFVDSIVNDNNFTFKTTSSAVPSGTSSIYFFDPSKYNSRNIKRVNPGRPVLNNVFIAGSTSFGAWIDDNYDFNATFNTPLANVDNACTIGSSSRNDLVALNYFYFYSPPRKAGYAGATLTTYVSIFSVVVFT